jgi:hypothetical protein
MIKGKLIVYRYNGLIQSREGAERNIYNLKEISAATPDGFKNQIRDSLDEVPPGKGYVLVKWSDRLFMCEQDINNPDVDYIRHEITYHPLAGVFDV